VERRQGGQQAEVVDGLQGLGHSGQPGGVLRQLGAPDRRQGAQGLHGGRRIAGMAPGQGLQHVGQGIVQGVGLPGLVDPAQAAHPGRSGKGQALRHPALLQVRQHRRRPALRDLLRAVGGDLVHPVAQGGVGKAMQQLVAVGGPVGALQAGAHLVGHQIVHELSNLRLRHAIADAGQAQHRSHGGHGAVTAVEQAQLGLLERGHVGHHPHALRGQCLCIGRVGQVVFDHPFPERFGAQRGCIAQAQGVLRRLQQFGRCRRHDAVDHAVGETHLLRNPVGQCRIARLRQAQALRPQAAAVVHQVVAGGDGEAQQPGQAPPCQTFDQQFGEARAVAFFGDGEGDPAGGRCGDGGVHLRRGLGSHAHAPEGSPQYPVLAVGAADAHRVPALLLRQGLGHSRLTHGKGMHAPAAIALAQQGVEHQGLVGAVKGAQAQVHHPRRATAVVGRHGQPICQPGQRGIAQHGVSQTAALRSGPAPRR